MSVQKRRVRWGNRPKFKLSKMSDRPSTSSNRFDILSDDSCGEEEDSYSIREKVPPIIVDTTHSFTSVLKLIGNRYTFKRMSVGTKIMAESLSLYEEALKTLKSNQYKFYTHEIKDSKSFKMVMFGLPKMENATIFEEFNDSHNIKPLSVKEITTKRTTVDDALYLIEFDRQHVSKREVMKIRYFHNISVFWKKPLKGNKGPTQCTKCSMYGHGARNCNRVDVCPACAGNHDYAVCTLNKTSCDGSVIYKCYNCTKKNLRNVNHRADDPRCPCRKEYLEIRKRTTSRSQATPRKNSFVANTDVYAENFPQTANHDNEPKTYGPRSHSKKSYSEVSKDKNLNNNNNDDISNDRLLEIFFDAVDALEKCKTKYDKLRVLGMMLQHAL